MLTENDKAYIAGLFDGEGSVDYKQRWEKRTKGRKYKVWRIHCEISMTHKYIIQWVHEVLGMGTVRPKKVPKGKKPQWRWRCSFREALQFAMLVWPHVQVKLHKLEQIIDHYSPEEPSADIIYLKDKRK